MKTIAIVYNPKETNSRSLAEKLPCILPEHYQITLCPLENPDSIRSFFSTWQETLPHLILTINLAGFELRTTGNDAAYTKLPVNFIHYISKSPSHYREQLQGLIDFTAKFIVTTPEAKTYLEKNYSNIYDITLTTSLTDSLPPILEQLDWRLA
ncbi:MAG: hypothetical protein J1F02_12250 [Lachnospiraceae bacterium]|nr:hypothetical protein [Lachnospiraceae bacterium]